MSLSYLKIQKKPTTFLHLFGISVEQFETILAKVRPEWQSLVVSSYKRPGRPYDLQLEPQFWIISEYLQELEGSFS